MRINNSRKQQMKFTLTGCRVYLNTYLILEMNKYLHVLYMSVKGKVTPVPNYV